MSFSRYEYAMYGHLIEAAEDRQRLADEAAEFMKHPTMQGAVRFMSVAQYQAELAESSRQNPSTGATAPLVTPQQLGDSAAVLADPGVLAGSLHIARAIIRHAEGL